MHLSLDAGVEAAALRRQCTVETRAVCSKGGSLAWAVLGRQSCAGSHWHLHHLIASPRDAIPPCWRMSLIPQASLLPPSILPPSFTPFPQRAGWWCLVSHPTAYSWSQPCTLGLCSLHPFTTATCGQPLQPVVNGMVRLVKSGWRRGGRTPHRQAPRSYCECVCVCVYMAHTTS